MNNLRYKYKYKNIQGCDINTCEISINDSYCCLNPYFIGGARNTENTAAIKIECNNVTIDLNNHSISQSKLFACEQRIYSIIELNRRVFTNSGDKFQPGPQIEQPGCSNITIKNGIIGRTSHFGIHGTNTNMLFVKDVNFIDFEVSGIWINNASMCHIDNCNLSGLTNTSQPICELAGFGTTGTGKIGIVDSNMWGIFLNDTAGQVQRSFATESNRFLSDEPPYNGKEIGGFSHITNKIIVGDNKTLDGPRNCSITNTNISDIKSNMIQSKVVSRLNSTGLLVPIAFSIFQGGHPGMTMSREYILNSIKDGFDNCKNRYNEKYIEICNSYVINTNDCWDINNNKIMIDDVNLMGTIIVNKASIGVNFTQPEDYDLTLCKNKEFITIDDFYVSDGYLFIRSILGNENVKNVKIKISDCKCINTSTTHNSHSNYGKIKCGSLIERKFWNNIKKINNKANLIIQPGIQPGIERNWCVLSNTCISPNNVENKYKLASKCIRKDLTKCDSGIFPRIIVPNDDISDIHDTLKSTMFEYQPNSLQNGTHMIQNNSVDPHPLTHNIEDLIKYDKNGCIIPNNILTENRRLSEFIMVEDNHPCPSRCDIHTKNQHREGVVAFEEIELGIFSQKIQTESNTDGEKYIAYKGDYITYYIGNRVGLTATQYKSDPCKQPDYNLKTLYAKAVLTIPLVNEMLSGREKFRKIDTDRKNGIDAGGHNMIGTFGIQLERAWGVNIENVNINSCMVFNGEGGWGENWWGLMANDSSWNTFKKIHISNLAGNPGTVFGFHLSNGSHSNTSEDIVVSGCISESETYGITVDLGSSSNQFNNCLVSESLGHEFAAGYVIRGSDNTFTNCKAERILLVINNDSETAADAVSAGFIMDTEEEESPLNPGGNILNNCSSNAIRVISEREFNKYMTDIYDFEEDEPGMRYDKNGELLLPHKFSLSYAKNNSLIHSVNSLIQRDCLSASRPLFLSNKNLLNTTASGILIIHQHNCIIDKCNVSNITSHGFSSGILATDELFKHEFPNLNTNHIFRNNKVDNIISFNPCILPENINGEILESKVARHGIVSNTYKFNRKMYNPYNSEIWNTLIENEYDIANNPHVVGIGDIRLCDKNRFTELFSSKETDIDFDLVFPCFCSDTLVTGNSVTNSYNYWTKVDKSYSFYYKSEAWYTQGNPELLSGYWEKLNYNNKSSFSEAYENINKIKKLLHKNENNGLLLIEYDINNIGNSIGKPNENTDLFLKELYNTTFNNKPYSSDGKILEYMTKQDRITWIYAMKSASTILYNNSVTNMIQSDLKLLEITPILKHAEVEAHAIQPNEVETHFDVREIALLDTTNGDTMELFNILNQTIK